MAKPLSVRTKMSYQLARLRFSELAYKQIWQANNGGNPPYSWVYVWLSLPSFSHSNYSTEADSIQIEQ